MSRVNDIARRSALVVATGLAGMVALCFPRDLGATPAFARQTGQSCVACHQGGEYPLLTDYGRQFKLTGYSASSDESQLPPVSFFLQPSFTSTAKGQTGGAAKHFDDNQNAALSQGSILYTGRLFGPYADKLLGESGAAFLNKFGAFLQATYDGVGKSFSWDNAEIRYADMATMGGERVEYGFYVNNNPTMQDLWNTTPVWGYPFSGSGLAPTPGAATLLEGGLSQQVLGLGAYSLVAKSFYIDAALYRTMSAAFQRGMGVDPSEDLEISGGAPYLRVAYTQAASKQSYETGLFVMVAKTYPGRDHTAGKDRYLDLGWDAHYQTNFGKHYFTALLSSIYEKQNFGASEALGGATNADGELVSSKITVDYNFDKTLGGAVSYFRIDGSRDAGLYSDGVNGSPDSDGVILQANYLPFGKSGGPAFWPASSVILSAQYTIYNRFDGSRSNYDGAGRDAWDNNTLYIEAWVAF